MTEKPYSNIFVHTSDKLRLRLLADLHRRSMAMELRVLLDNATADNPLPTIVTGIKPNYLPDEGPDHFEPPSR